MTGADPTTQSNYLSIASYHVDLAWELDWKNQQISGSVVHHMRARNDGVKEVV